MPIMAFDETFDITNPAQLAQPFAIDIRNASGYYEAELTSFEEEIENTINQAIGYLGLRGTYLVEAGLAWIMQPCRLTKKFSKNVADIPNLKFAGNFFEYEIIKLDGADIKQERKIRSLCMIFRDATLLPDFDKLAGDNLAGDNMVYVPVAAVDDDDIVRIK